MPTPSQMCLPTTNSDSEFEDMCVDVLSQKYGTSFQRFGRKGQRQNGIDLYADNFKIVAQCKNHHNYRSIVSEIQSDYDEAIKEFGPQKFIVATSLNRDVNIQTQISNIAQNIEILFWEDIQQIICNDNMMLQRFYPSILSNNQFIPIPVLNETLRLLSILKSKAKHINTEYVYYRPLYNCSSDTDLYNICVDMFNASHELCTQLYNFNIQFEHQKLREKIQCVIDSLPEFHDATNDIVGTEFACTIWDFLKYFCNKENATKYISQCQEVIDIIYQISNKT